MSERLVGDCESRQAGDVEGEKDEKSENLDGVEHRRDVGAAERLLDHQHRQFLAQDAEKDRYAEFFGEPEPPGGDRNEHFVDEGISTEMAEQGQYDAADDEQGGDDGHDVFGAFPGFAPDAVPGGKRVGRDGLYHAGGAVGVAPGQQLAEYGDGYQG